MSVLPDSSLRRKRAPIPCPEKGCDPLATGANCVACPAVLAERETARQERSRGRAREALRLFVAPDRLRAAVAALSDAGLFKPRREDCDD